MQGTDETRHEDQPAGDGWLGHLENLSIYLAVVAIFLIMIFVAWTVVMRYAFNNPPTWTQDIIGSYLMVAAFFLAISAGLRTRTHIVIDVFVDHIPAAIRHVVLAPAYLLSAGVMFLITWQGGMRLAASWMSSEIISLTIPWPTWPTYLILCIGCFLMGLRCLYLGVGSVCHLLGRGVAERAARTPEPITSREHAP